MMATYDDELLKAARWLIDRRRGQRGKLSAARVRRSISTTYYAIFHFLLEEAARSLIGSHNDLRRRRRTFTRTFTHLGMKTALEKIRGANVDASVADFLRPSGTNTSPVVASPFARNMAAAFSDAQAKRHDADYDLNKGLSEVDARLLILRVRRAIAAWRAASTAADKDFKNALSMLMVLKGQLRRED